MSEAEEYLKARKQFLRNKKDNKNKVWYSDALEAVRLARKEATKQAIKDYATNEVAFKTNAEYQKELENAGDEARLEITEKINSFFDKQIENIYQEVYGDSEDPMSFDEIKGHLKTWLEVVKND